MDNEQLFQEHTESPRETNNYFDSYYALRKPSIDAGETTNTEFPRETNNYFDS